MEKPVFSDCYYVDIQKCAKYCLFYVKYIKSYLLFTAISKRKNEHSNLCCLCQFEYSDRTSQIKLNYDLVRDKPDKYA